MIGIDLAPARLKYGRGQVIRREMADTIGFIVNMAGADGTVN